MYERYSFSNGRIYMSMLTAPRLTDVPRASQLRPRRPRAPRAPRLRSRGRARAAAARDYKLSEKTDLVHTARESCDYKNGRALSSIPVILY